MHYISGVDSSSITSREKVYFPQLIYLRIAENKRVSPVTMACDFSHYAQLICYHVSQAFTVGFFPNP
jgi:hypothetical protein